MLASIPLAFVAGLLGSAHCVGMCGPFVLAIGSGAAQHRVALLRQLAYTAGRIVMYALLGATAGFVGARIQSQAPAILRIPSILAILAGGFLIWQGVTMFFGQAAAQTKSGAGCLAESFFSPIARARSLPQSFVAGVLTGLLPCGLLYGMIALATTSGEMLTGAGTLAAFAAGTAPPLIALGWSANLLTRWPSFTRTRLFRAAACLLLIAGTISVARGVQSWRSISDPKVPACPYCAKSGE